MTQKKEPAPLSAADVQKMIDDALAKLSPDQKAIVLIVDERLSGLNFVTADQLDEVIAANARAYEEFVAKMPETILGVVKDVNLFGDRISDEVANHFAEADFSEPFDAAVAKLGLTPDNLGTLVDAAMDSRAARDADKAAAAAKDEATAKGEAAAAQVKADKAAAARLEKDERKRAADYQKQVDRAARDYAALLASPVASALTIATGQTITLRLGDGSTFHPDHGLELGTADLNDEVGRAVNAKVIALPADFSPFTACEAILIVEGGKGPAALYRSPIESPLRFGGGAAAQLAPGALAFRRVSPEPEAVEAA